jgi:plasmid stability protein
MLATTHEMATLTIRKLNDTIYENLGKRARANNRSLEAEARDILDREANATKAFDIKEWVAEVRELNRKSPMRPRPGEDAVSIIRAIRDE